MYLSASWHGGQLTQSAQDDLEDSSIYKGKMEKVLNDRELLFLQFVREALWRKEALPKAMDADELQALMVLARQHAVPALVADAVVRNGLVTNDDCTLEMVAVCMKHRKKTKMVTVAPMPWLRGSGKSTGQGLAGAWPLATVQ